MKATSWEELHAQCLESMTSHERVEYDAAAVEADARLDLAELVYNARVAAGLTQSELAQRAGTRQSVISAIENASQARGGVMLTRIAQALGGSLTIRVAA